jgi:hypothetical protein
MSVQYCDFVERCKSLDLSIDQVQRLLKEDMYLILNWVNGNRPPNSVMRFLEALLSLPQADRNSLITLMAGPDIEKGVKQ